MTQIPPRSKGKIIVCGLLFWYPLAGVTYQFLHYLIGLRRLGYDPYYVEDSSQWIYDPTINDLSPDASRNVAWLAPIMEAHGFAGRWAFRERYAGGKCYGMTEQELLSLYRQADALLNITGMQDLTDEHMRIPRRIYIESDPFSAQAKIANGNKQTLAELAVHDMHFSFGENIGAADCGVPSTPFTFLPTRQPVVTDLWNNSFPPGQVYNTITTWSNKGKNIEYAGETYYWTKDREFEKVLELPRLRRVPFELATNIAPEVQEMLVAHGWRHSSSIDVSRDLNRYQHFIQQSRGEFTVARDQYVRPRTGWFSDRSVCYLAAGRPVITQETGFSKFLPTGEGLFPFQTLDDVLTAVDKIESDYPKACKAARDVAAEYFEAEKVVGSVMQRAGL